METLEQRIANFKSMGLDAVLVLHFDLALAAVTAQEFVRGVLVDQLRAATILVGQTFRFGYQNAGDVGLLADMGLEFKFDVEIIPPVVLNGLVVSSTAVRRAILDGRPVEAARLLGRPFSLTGKTRWPLNERRAEMRAYGSVQAGAAPAHDCFS